MCIVLKTEKPIIDCYPDLANMLSILEGRHICDKWIASNFIQLVYRRNSRTSYGSFLDFMRTGNDITVYQNCPYLYVNYIDKDFVEDLFENIFIFLEYSLKNNFYIQLYTNKKYLPQSNPPVTDFMHETFVYGISTEKKKVFLADFYDGKYKNIECGFDQFMEAYIHSFYDNPYYKSEIYTDTNLAKYNFNRIILLRFNAHNLYNFDKEIIIEKIHDYIKCEDSFKRIRESYIASGYQFYYGLDFYDQLSLDIDSQVFDNRKSYVLLSHKILMKKQITILLNEGIICNSDYELIMNILNPLISELENAWKKYALQSFKKNLRRSDLKLLIDQYMDIKDKDCNLMKLYLKILS